MELENLSHVQKNLLENELGILWSKTVLEKKNLNKPIKNRTAIKLQREITNSLRIKICLGQNKKI